MEDYHNFSESTSPTRLPALSGAQILEDFISNNRPIPTNLKALDNLLCPEDSLPERDGAGGVLRGSVTEIFGPSGSGKTALAMQLAVNAAYDGSTVVWIDCATELPINRLRDFVMAKTSADKKSHSDAGGGIEVPTRLLENIRHLKLLRIQYLVAILSQPPAEFPPPNTSLMVIDDLSRLVLSSLPNTKPRRPIDAGSGSQANSRDEILRRETLNRRSSLIANVASALHRLAASKNVALVVLNSMSMLQRPGAHALIRPSLNTPSWIAAMFTRLGLYRSFWPGDNSSKSEGSSSKNFTRPAFRIVRVERLSGKDVKSDDIPFTITTQGILPAFTDADSVPVIALLPKITGSTQEEEADMLQTSIDNDADLEELEVDGGADMEKKANISEAVIPPRSKRKVDEIMDSEDEEIDWPSIDEVRLPTMPKQQGGFLPSSQLMQESTQKNDDPTLPSHPRPTSREVPLPDT